MLQIISRVSSGGQTYADFQRQHLGLPGGGKSLDFTRELGIWKGFRGENQSLPGLCRFHFETVSIYGNFIFVASSALHRISFCYDNTLLGFFYSWKRSQHSGA